LLDLLAMFIRSCQEEDILAHQALESRPGVANRRCVDMTDVRSVIDVVDRGGDAAGLAHGTGSIDG